VGASARPACKATVPAPSSIHQATSRSVTSCCTTIVGSTTGTIDPSAARRMASSQLGERNSGIGGRLATPAGARPVQSLAMQEIGTGEKVFDHAAVRGRWKVMEGPSDVLDLMDSGADGVIALVRDAGATFLAPIFHELAGVVCSGGTSRSHIGIVSREFQVPCIMACQIGEVPADGTEVEVDCSGASGVLRA